MHGGARVGRITHDKLLDIYNRATAAETDIELGNIGRAKRDIVSLKRLCKKLMGGK